MNFLDDIYRSGYCLKAVEHARGTPRGVAGRQERRDWMLEHSRTCPDCFHASLFKNLEGEISKELGFHEEFEAGGDVTQIPGFQPVFRAKLQALLESEKIENSAVVEWLERVSSREHRITGEQETDA